MAFDFPSSPAENQTYTPAGGPTYVYVSGVWKIQGSMGAPGNLYVGDTPPVSPVAGQMWWESDTGNLFAYVNDGSSSQWVQINVPNATYTTAVRVQTFAASGTYTPNPKMTSCVIECIGGGGAGGGANGNAGYSVAGAGGGSGSYSRKYCTRADIGASKPVTVAAGGVPVGASNGGGGGTTSVSTLCTGNGGNGGYGATWNYTLFGQSAPPCGPGTGDVAFYGSTGVSGFIAAGASHVNHGGAGGAGYSGGSGQGALNASGGNGSSGGGGGGGQYNNSVGAPYGGYGGNGLVIITEYCSG